MNNLYDLLESEVSPEMAEALRSRGFSWFLDLKTRYDALEEKRGNQYVSQSVSPQTN